MPQWSERGADSWNFFSSPNSSDITFGMVYQYGTGDHVADVYSYNDNVVSVADNVITFKRSGTINVQYGIHCDNGKDFVGYCLNGIRTDFGQSLGMYEMKLEVSKNDTLYFLSSNTTTNRRTTIFGFVKIV